MPITLPPGSSPFGDPLDYRAIVRPRQETPENHGQPWTTERDERLWHLFWHERRDLRFIAESLGRTASAVESRLTVMTPGTRGHPGSYDYVSAFMARDRAIRAGAGLERRPVVRTSRVIERSPGIPSITSVGEAATYERVAEVNEYAPDSVLRPYRAYSSISESFGTTPSSPLPTARGIMDSVNRFTEEVSLSPLSPRLTAVELAEQADRERRFGTPAAAWPSPEQALQAAPRRATAPRAPSAPPVNAPRVSENEQPFTSVQRKLIFDALYACGDDALVSKCVHAVAGAIGRTTPGFGLENIPPRPAA